MDSRGVGLVVVVNPQFREPGKLWESRAAVQSARASLLALSLLVQYYYLCSHLFSLCPAL